MISIKQSRVSRRRAIGVAGTAAGAAAFLAACGSDKDESSTQSSAGTSGSTSAAGQSSTTTARSGGSVPTEFVVANELEPPHLAPFWSGFPQQLVTRQLYESFLRSRLALDSSGVAKVTFVPVLATSTEQVEPKRWRLKLRPGVTFHNGEKWDAQAAKFGLDTYMDTKLLASLKQSAPMAALLDGYEVVDEMTVDLITKRAENEVPQRLHSSFIAVPPKLVQEKGLEYLFENPVGTGPYKLKSFNRGQDVRFEKFAEHWDKDGPQMQQVRYIVRREAAVRAQTVKAGEAHFAYNIGNEQAQGIKNAAVGGGFQSSGLRFNNQIAPTNDVRLRKALNYAVDRDAIIKGIFRGAATRIAFFGFQPVKLEAFPYKPDEAKKLIDAAGARGAQLELVYGEGRIPEEDQLAEVYKAAFDAVGLKINIRKVEPRVYEEIGTRPFPEQPPLYMETTSSGNSGEIAGGLRDKFGCQGTGTFCKPEFDAEFDLLPTLSESERVTKLQSIAERLHNDETPRMWVAAVQQVHAFADFVRPALPLNLPFMLSDLKIG